MKITAPNFTQTPNDLFDKWLPHLGEAELKVLLVILRKTFGWHKTKDCISLTQLSEATGLLRETVIKAARSLQKKGLILREVIGSKGHQQTYYELFVEENSDGAPQSVKPTPLVGLDPLGSTDPQKKCSSLKETAATERKKNAAAVFSENEKEKPSTSDNMHDVIFSCVDIPEDDKIEIAKRYSEETIKNAIAWATHPETKITKGLAPAIKWACKNKPKVPKTPPPSPKVSEAIENQNREFAMKFHGMEQGSTRVTVREACVEILFGGVHKSAFMLGYREHGFKEQLESMLRKAGFPIERKK